MRDYLLELAERIAKERHDGHLTIYRFTSGWKAFFGTLDAEGTDYGAIAIRRTAPTMTAALCDAIQGEPDGFYCLEFAIGKATMPIVVRAK